MMTLRGQDHAARADLVISDGNLRHRFSYHGEPLARFETEMAEVFGTGQNDCSLALVRIS